VDYVLKAREPGSAQRRGFDGRDVLLNLMPDRFANGDPSNDNVPGMGDPADRHAPGSRYGGDLHGVMDRLDYLADMGFTAVWMTPVVENRQPSYSQENAGPPQVFLRPLGGAGTGEARPLGVLRRFPSRRRPRHWLRVQHAGPLVRVGARGCWA
jgi:hypothetical protein